MCVKPVVTLMLLQCWPNRVHAPKLLTSLCPHTLQKLNWPSPALYTLLPPGHHHLSGPLARLASWPGLEHLPDHTACRKLAVPGGTGSGQVCQYYGHTCWIGLSVPLCPGRTTGLALLKCLELVNNSYSGPRVCLLQGQWVLLFYGPCKPFYNF